MPAVAKEIGDARKVTRYRSAETAFLVTGTSSESAALNAVLAAMPVSIDGMPLKDLGPIRSIGDPTATERWICGVQYAPASGGQRRPVGSTTLSFHVATRSERVYAALTHIADYPTGAANYQGALNVTDETVEGVDVDVWSLGVDVVKTFVDGDAVPDIHAILALSGIGGRTPVNNAPVTLVDSETGVTMTFAAGELRLMGFDMGRARDDGAVEISYSFLAAPNATNVTVPGGGNCGALKGHEYLWVRFRDQWDAVLKMTLKTPSSGHKETLYPPASFTALGL